MTRIIADTIAGNSRLVTIEADVPTWSLAQIGKHRAFSLSAQSARAVPIKSMVKDVPKWRPVFHGQPDRRKAKGMRDGVTLPPPSQKRVRQAWNAHEARTEYMVLELERIIAEEGYGIAKGELNRLLAPFRLSRIVMTGLVDDHAWGWFFRLRCGQDAQSPVMRFASEVRDAIRNSEPSGHQIHIPYRDEHPDLGGADLITMSIARCATVSYRQAPSLAKARRIVSLLMDEGHWVPFEHVCMRARDAGVRVGFYATDVAELAGNHFRHRADTEWWQVRKLYDPHTHDTTARRDGREALGLPFG